MIPLLQVAPATIDDHHDLMRGCAEGRHHWVEILAQLLGIKMGPIL
jgi:hypothetical protein